MKTILFILTTTFSYNLLAATTLICNDQNSHSVYNLQISSDSSTMLLSPLLRDSSTLSKSITVLGYNEGESNEKSSLYAGVNADNNTIVIEGKVKAITLGEIQSFNVYYSKNISPLNQKTLFLCSVMTQK